MQQGTIASSFQHLNMVQYLIANGIELICISSVHVNIF